MADNLSSAGAQNQKNDQTPINIAIIGGGLSGLFTAALLEREFAQAKAASARIKIDIFEKSRSVGRLATRYRSDKQTNSKKQWQWAFGAQFFTAKTESFSRFLEPWLETGLLRPWLARVVNLTPASDNDKTSIVNVKEKWDSHHARYISTPKMTSWGRELASTLQHTTIHFETRIVPLTPQSFIQNTARKTELFDHTDTSLGQFDWVICTAPNIQAMDLMADSGFSEQDKILQSNMLACYTLLLGWDGIDSLPETLKHQSNPVWDVAYLPESIVDRIFVEHQKPAHGHVLPSVTIHARNDWSEQHVDEDIESIQMQLLAAAKQALNWHDHTAPSQVDCHRWRYAATVIDNDSAPVGVLVDKEHQWIVSGDWCWQGNIESSFQMAEEVVKVVAERLR